MIYVVLVTGLVASTYAFYTKLTPDFLFANKRLRSYNYNVHGPNIHMAHKKENVIVFG